MNLIDKHVEKYWNDEEISIEEKRLVIKSTNKYYNYWSDDNWLVEGRNYSNPDMAGISTQNLWKSIILNEIDNQISKGNIIIQYK